MNDRDFYFEVAKALSGCQLVEQELKLYLADAFALAQKCIGERMVFEFSGQDYEDSSLERLITAFKKLTSNKELVKRLGKFKEERNHLSHKAIANCLDYERELSIPDTEYLKPRLEHLKEEANDICRAIHDEARKFQPHLWFWDVGNDD